jgi:hypothetical protein
LAKVLSGLRAHDERAVEMLAIPQENLMRAERESSWLGEAPESDDEEDHRLLLRFGTRRDPAIVARFVQYNVIKPEHANWKAGYRAAVAYWQREGHLSVPYNHVEGAIDPQTDAWRGGGFPLGRWLSDQRRAMRAGGLLSERAEELDALGIVWEPTDEAWEENLGAARAYFDAYGTLAAPVTATMLDKPVGHWLANCRKAGGLGKDQARARRREQLLAAIDPDWRPDWPVDWQRHYAALAQLVQAGTAAGEVDPGTRLHGMNVGRWLHTQRLDWPQLTAGQREWLAQLGVTPAPRPVPAQAGAGRRCGGGEAVWRPCSGFRAGLRGARAIQGPHRVRDRRQGSCRAVAGRYGYGSGFSCPTPRAGAPDLPRTSSQPSPASDSTGQGLREAGSGGLVLSYRAVPDIAAGGGA